MKTTVLSLVMLLACAWSARGQVHLVVRPEHDAVLQHERTRLFVTVRNDSGLSILMDTRNPRNTVHFEVLVTKNRGTRLKPRSSRPLVNRLFLEPDESEELMIDLTDGFDLSAMGHYQIRASLTFEGRTYTSARVVIDVVNGMEVAKVRRVVAGYADLTREYSLRYWRRDMIEQLFLRVDEPSTETNYGVFGLGPLLRVATPQVTVDSDGTIVVIHQSGPDRYTRSTLRSERNSVLFVDQTFHRRDGRVIGEQAPFLFPGAPDDAN